jgi:hypothetical protein
MIFRRPTHGLVPLAGAGCGSAREPVARFVCRTAVMTVATISIALAGAGNRLAHAENPDISSRRASERTEFTGDEIKDGFFKIAFRAEMQIGAPAERIRKFDEPVRILVINKALPDRSSAIAAVVADIRARVNHLDLAITSDPAAANFVVRLVANRDLARTIRSLYGIGRAKRIQQSLNPQCLSGIGKDARYRIRRAEVILPADAGEFTFYDCAYEELLQALGAINDDQSVPWTMFNDEVQMGFFDIYDQYLLNILYDPRLRPGMTKQEVSELWPELLPTVRAWVGSSNSPRHAASRGRPNDHPTQALTAQIGSTHAQASGTANANQRHRPRSANQNARGITARVLGSAPPSASSSCRAI